MKLVVNLSRTCFEKFYRKIPVGSKLDKHVGWDTKRDDSNLIKWQIEESRQGKWFVRHLFVLINKTLTCRVDSCSFLLLSTSSLNPSQCWCLSTFTNNVLSFKLNPVTGINGLNNFYSIFKCIEITDIVMVFLI